MARGMTVPPNAWIIAAVSSVSTMPATAKIS